MTAVVYCGNTRTQIEKVPNVLGGDIVDECIGLLSPAEDHTPMAPASSPACEEQTRKPVSDGDL